MRKLTILICLFLLLCSPPVSAADWEILYQDSFGVMEINNDDIKSYQTNPLRKNVIALNCIFWTKMTLLQNGAKTDKIMISWEFDMINKRARITKAYSLGSNSSKINPLQMSTDWIDIVPESGSAFEDMYNYINIRILKYDEGLNHKKY